ncbi:MAG: putative motility protein [Verrucomicrobiae bacterium]|nr:putative motility protein [Verrucomicrobiae bacterium]
MDSINAIAAQSGQTGVSGAVTTTMLKKALDMQQQTVATLIGSLPAVGGGSNAATPAVPVTSSNHLVDVLA